jgi:hypothetical protein
VERRKRLDRHPCPDPAGIEQAPIRLVVAQQQRADRVTRPLRIRPTDDDELSAVEALALDPNAAIAWQITAVGSL